MLDLPADGRQARRARPADPSAAVQAARRTARHDGRVGAAAGLHANGVRVHLDRLERDGLLIRTTERRPRGRPRNRWTIAPDARPSGQPPRGYRDLARWLSRAIDPRTTQPTRRLEATGRAIGRELAPAKQSQPSQALIASLAALGFQPHIQIGDPGDFTICLDNCPYSEAVTENQAAICTLHRGITRGLLEVLEPQARLTAFEPQDPHTAGCTIRITGIAPPRPTRE